MTSSLSSFSPLSLAPKTAGDAPKAAAAPGTDALATKDTFLQLLVAQLRHQNPLQPTDGVEFLSQLAQFTSLEQAIQLNTNVAGMGDSLDRFLAANQKTLPDGN